MPIVIKELVITIRSEASAAGDGPDRFPEADPGTPESVADTDTRATIVREAVEEALRVQRETKER